MVDESQMTTSNTDGYRGRFVSFVLGGQEGSYQICHEFPAKERVKSTAAEFFSFPSGCEGRSSDLDR